VALQDVVDLFEGDIAEVSGCGGGVVLRGREKGLKFASCGCQVALTRSEQLVDLLSAESGDVLGRLRMEDHDAFRQADGFTDARNEFVAGCAVHGHAVVEFSGAALDKVSGTCGPGHPAGAQVRDLLGFSGSGFLEQLANGAVVGGPFAPDASGDGVVKSAQRGLFKPLLNLGANLGELSFPVGGVVRGAEHVWLKRLPVEAELCNGFDEMTDVEKFWNGGQFAQLKERSSAGFWREERGPKGNSRKQEAGNSAHLRP
jgi:hypothetical protein